MVPPAPHNPHPPSTLSILPPRLSLHPSLSLSLCLSLSSQLLRLYQDDQATQQNTTIERWLLTQLVSWHFVFSYAIVSRKLSANEQFFCWCSDSSKFVTNNSDYIRRLFYKWPCCLRQLRWNQNRLNRDGTLFLPRGGCASCLCACLGARLLLQSHLVLKPFGWRWPRRWTAARR